VYSRVVCIYMYTALYLLGVDREKRVGFVERKCIVVECLYMCRMGFGS